MKREDTELSFEAPEDGYKPTLEMQMLPTAKRWHEDDDGQYWLKLGNGTYARMRFRITTGGGHFASVVSFLNPKPGSRNLEYDPVKQASAR